MDYRGFKHYIEPPEPLFFFSNESKDLEPQTIDGSCLKSVDHKNENNMRSYIYDPIRSM